jgi:hypothetical protein
MFKLIIGEKNLIKNNKKVVFLIYKNELGYFNALDPSFM